MVWLCVLWLCTAKPLSKNTNRDLALVVLDGNYWCYNMSRRFNVLGCDRHFWIWGAQPLHWWPSKCMLCDTFSFCAYSVWILRLRLLTGRMMLFSQLVTILALSLWCAVSSLNSWFILCPAHVISFFGSSTSVTAECLRFSNLWVYILTMSLCSQILDISDTLEMVPCHDFDKPS